MNNYDIANHIYRFRFKVGRRERFKTEGFARQDSTKKIAKWNHDCRDIVSVGFMGNKISEKHRQTLMEFARLGNELDQMEGEVNKKICSQKKLLETRQNSK